MLEPDKWAPWIGLGISGAVTVIATGLGVWLGAWFAMRAYFRQKENELIKERYLDGAVDVVASEIERAFEVFRHNSARCLNIMKAFRDEKRAFNLEELSKGFVDYKIAHPRIALYRIGNLVGSHVIRHLYETAIAFVYNANTKFTKEYPDTIRLKLDKGMVRAEPEEIFCEAYQTLGVLDTESKRFEHLTHALHRLGQMFEQERFMFKRAVKFSRRPDVKQLVADLKEEMKDDLKDFVHH